MSCRQCSLRGLRAVETRSTHAVRRQCRRRSARLTEPVLGRVRLRGVSGVVGVLRVSPTDSPESVRPGPRNFNEHTGCVGDATERATGLVQVGAHVVRATLGAGVVRRGRAGVGGTVSRCSFGRNTSESGDQHVRDRDSQPARHGAERRRDTVRDPFEEDIQRFEWRPILNATASVPEDASQIPITSDATVHAPTAKATRYRSRSNGATHAARTTNPIHANTNVSRSRVSISPSRSGRVAGCATAVMTTAATATATAKSNPTRAASRPESRVFTPTTHPMLRASDSLDPHPPESRPRSSRRRSRGRCCPRSRRGYLS